MMVEQCVCRLCGDIREEQIGSEAAHEKICEGCKEGKYVNELGMACCVYCHKVEHAQMILYVDDDGVHSHLQCQAQAVLREIHDEGIDVDNLPPMPVEPIQAIQAVCKCGEQHVYIDTLPGYNDPHTGEWVDSLDGFYCVANNKFWREL